MSWHILGHETAISFLKEQTKAEKLRQAYLITGPEGVGRRTLALAFIKTLNCLNPLAPGEFCGECLPCRQIEAREFADLMIVLPEESGRDLKIDLIRAMQQTLSLAPYQSGYRIVLIPDFQRATAAASNALLKSLEEPPSRAIIILTADAKESLLETIASRCELLRLRPLSVQDAQRGLTAQYRLPEDRAQMLAHLSGGRIGTAMRFEREPELLSAYNEALDSLEELLSAKKRERFQYVERQLKQKTTPRILFAATIAAWLTFWRDVMIARSGADIPLVNLAREEQVGASAGQFSAGQIEAILKTHEKALDQLDRYVNPRLIMENLLLSIPRLKL